jgi:transcriptional regulator with XRE-family HTH domain
MKQKETQVATHLALEQLVALLKAKRGKRGLREVAQEIGNVSASTLSRVEKGKMPDLDTFIRLCDWLEISPDQFFQRDEKKPLSPEGSLPPISPGMTTPEIIEVHFRADKELDPETAEALVNMVNAAYNAVSTGKLGRKKRG